MTDLAGHRTSTPLQRPDARAWRRLAARTAALVVPLAAATACLPYGPSDDVVSQPRPLAVGLAVLADSPGRAAVPAVATAPAGESTAVAAGLSGASLVPRGSQDTPTARERGAAALASLAFDLEALGWTIGFSDGRAGLLGVADPDRRHIEIYVRPAQSQSLLRSVIGHEIGHAVDDAYNDDARRARWRELRGIPVDRPWFGCSLCEDYGTPAGDFAEVFSLWLAGPLHFRSAVAGPPTPEQLVRLAELFRPRAPVAGGRPTSTEPARPAPPPPPPEGAEGGPSPAPAPSPSSSPTRSPAPPPPPACLPVVGCG